MSLEAWTHCLVSRGAQRRRVPSISDTRPITPSRTAGGWHLGTVLPAVHSVRIVHQRRTSAIPDVSSAVVVVVVRWNDTISKTISRTIAIMTIVVTVWGSMTQWIAINDSRNIVTRLL